MRTVSLAPFTQPTQSYAIVSYPAQQSHQVQDMATQPRSSHTMINDQPLEIDPASQLTPMKVCDSVVSLPINNPVESNIPLYNVASTHPSTQIQQAGLTNRVPVVQPQQGLNIGVIDANGLYYLVTTPSSSQPTITVTQPNLHINVPTTTTVNNSVPQVVTIPERFESMGNDSLVVVNSTNTLSDASLANSVAQIAALINTCHVSVIPTDDLPTATPFSMPTQLSSSSIPSTLATMSGRSSANTIQSVQSCNASVVLPISHGGGSVPINFGNNLSYGISVRGSGFFDYSVSQDSQFPRSKYNSPKHKTVAERAYSSATVLWTPEKHEAFVAVYESLVNANEKITQGAIFKEMKKRYPNFQLTLRQIQSKLQKYRLRLNQEGSR